MSYLGPVRFFFKGDKKTAGRYIGDARRFVAQLQDQLGSGVTSARRRKVLSSGVVIDVVIAGGTVAATIVVPGGKKRTRWFEDFVVFSGASAFVDEELVFYPTIFKYVEDENFWIPYFWKSTVPGYAEAPSPKGTYVAVFPKPYNPPKRFFLSGAPMMHVNERGESVNWAGMQAFKYWTQPSRQPYAMYDGRVFHRGFELYNYASYSAKYGVSWSAKHVLGAALKDGWLYMMMAALDTGISYPTPANPAGVRRTAWVAPQYPGFNINYALRRVRMRTVMDYSTGLLHYELTADVEDLWTGSLPRAFNAWHFNPEVTECLSYGLPVSSTLIYTMGPEVLVSSTDARYYEKIGTVSTGLSSSHTRYHLALVHGEDGDVVATFGSSGQTTVVAESNGKVLEIVRVGGDWYYRLDGFDYPCIIIGATSFTIRQLKYVDIDTHRLCFHEVYESSVGTEITTRRRGILVHAGVETITETVTTSGNTGNIAATNIYWEGFQVLRAYLSTASISSMSILNLNVWGFLKEKFTTDIPDPGDDPVILESYDSRMAGHWPELLEVLIDDTRPSYGGGKLNSSVLEISPQWNTWDVTVGYDGFDNPDWFVDDIPPVYLTNTGAQSLANPDRFLISSRHNWRADPPIYVHYITNGDFGALAGGVMGVGDKVAISVNILGEAPIGQQEEY